MYRTRLGSATLLLLWPTLAVASVISAPGNIKVELQLVRNLGSGAAGVDSAATPANPNMLYVADYLSGTVYAVDLVTHAQNVFLTFASSGVTLAFPNVQGITFHPDFGDSTKPGYHKFYTYQLETLASAGGTANVMFKHPEVPSPATVDTVREWTATASGLAVTNTTSRIVWSGSTRSTNGHNGGGLRFGTDGYLYFTNGDGGGSGHGFSGSITDPSDGFTGKSDVSAISNGQDFTNVGGKLFRIDPIVKDAAGNPIASKPGETLKTFAAESRYFIPNDNPFASNPNQLFFRSNGSANPPVAPLPEIFALGFRNPYKVTIDSRPGGTGAIYVGDVGDHAWEEIDKITSGNDYGWPYREGHVVAPDAAAGRPTPVPWLKETSPGVFVAFSPTLSDPLTEFDTRYVTGAEPHSDWSGDGNAIVSGYIYRGSAIPQLYGMYVLGAYQYVVPENPNDLSHTQAVSAGGRLFYFDPLGSNDANGMKQIYELNFDAGFGIPGNGNGDLLGFGQDTSGELYVLFANGDVKLIAAPVPEPAGIALLATGVLGLILFRSAQQRRVVARRK